MTEYGTEELCKNWLSSNTRISDLITNNSNYKITIPDTCRYFTVATVKNLQRTGKHVLYAKNIDDFAIIYGLFNSTLGYYFYRMYNGGITYPIGLLKDMPVPVLSEQDMIKLKMIVKENSTYENCTVPKTSLEECFVCEEGYDYPVVARVTKCYFPDRRYGDVLFPKGYYEALRVEIGKAAGHNWWCVLYPALCFTDATCAVVTEEGEEELEKVKNRYESEQIFGNINYLNVATNLAFFELIGKAEDINDEVSKYRGVTAEDILRVASETFVHENCSVLYYKKQ